MATRASDKRSGIELLERAFVESLGGLPVPGEAHEQAHARARAVLEGPGKTEHLARIAMIGFAADMFVALAVELAARASEMKRLIGEIERVAEVPRVALAREVLTAPDLLQLPIAVGIEVQLALLLGFTEVRAVSLWSLWSSGELKHIAHAGRFDVEASQTRQLARRLLADPSTESPTDRNVAGILVDRWQQPAAALIARGKGASSTDRQLLLRAAVPILTAMLERDDLLGRGSSSEQAVVASTERRLARLRFDLHDGPQQDVVMLAEDLRLFRSQLGSVMGTRPNKDRLLNRVDDLHARLIALDSELHRISAAVRSPFLQPKSLPDALSQLTDAFAARTGIEPDTVLKGDLTDLTDSQQITLLGLIRESLSNIREHSDAQHVTIRLTARASGVKATVTDDGRGFEPEATLVKAAREGHLGLVGMHERVRLLGGRTQIDSRPGGPTVISVSLPSGPAVAPREPQPERRAAPAVRSGGRIKQRPSRARART